MATQNLREFARGKPCQIMLPGCLGEHEGNCLCHWRDSSTGLGQKEHDFIAAHGCYICHGLVDGRYGYPARWRPDVKLYFLEGIVRTQQIVLRALKNKLVRID